MKIQLDQEITKKYPNVEIGFLLAEVTVKKNDPFVEELKKELGAIVKKKGINATNFATHPNISAWRNIYENEFQVKAKTYRSSIESLIKRIVTGKSIWNISNIVDLYNCTSVSTLLSIGGYDLNKISGDITIRYAENGELFQSLGSNQKVETKSNHIVYSDNQRIICWLWNHKDSGETCIDENTTKVLFFIDAFDHKELLSALYELENNLKHIQCKCSQKGALNLNSPSAFLEVSRSCC